MGAVVGSVHVITNVSVSGMTCEHCVTRVTNELLSGPGVTAVDIHLETGAVTIDSDRALPAEAVRDAVVEAGYELVGV